MTTEIATTASGNSTPAPNMELNCTICEESSVKAEAYRYCGQCRKRLCLHCEKLHARLFKEHALLERQEVEAWVNVELGIPTLMCEVHNGEEMARFCSGHGVRCCTECAVLQHK